MVAAKEKTVSFKSGSNIEPMDNKPAHPTAAKTPSTVVNRISSYDFTTRKNQKPHYGSSEKIRPIVAVEPTTKPRKNIRSKRDHVRISHWAPELSFYRGYFVPGKTDPKGTDIGINPNDVISSESTRWCLKLPSLSGSMRFHGCSGAPIKYLNEDPPYDWHDIKDGTWVRGDGFIDDSWFYGWYFKVPGHCRADVYCTDELDRTGLPTGKKVISRIKCCCHGLLCLAKGTCRFEFENHPVFNEDDGPGDPFEDKIDK